jgi:hypothetical protein
MGIIGGRTIFMEDFESLISHYDASSSAFSITTTEGTVWEGDAAGKITLGSGLGGSYFAQGVVPTPDILSIEMMFKPGDGNLESTSLQYYIYNGEYECVPTVEIIQGAGGLLLRVRDKNNDLKTVAIFTEAAIAQRWHVLYMRFNLAEYLYEIAQYDGKRVLIADEEFYHIADSSSPYTYIQVYGKATTGHTSSLYFDNLVLAYEEL